MHPDHDNYCPGPVKARPLAKLPDFTIRPKETAGIHVEKAVNGFVVSCSAFEGNHYKGLAFVADAQSLPEVIRQVQEAQRLAILEFFAPKTTGGSQSRA